jgi:hypothetical protein
VIFVKKPPVDSPEWIKELQKKNLDQEWKTILDSSEKKRNAAIEEFDQKSDVDIDDTQYKKYMRFLLGLFREKCAYCETTITSNQPGDVEHFRPKGRVIDEHFKPIPVKHPKKGPMNHPGYFWLAYDWWNLLPSCIDCNRYRKHEGVDGDTVGVGKADRFPLENEKDRACVPETVVGEKALLIDPSAVDPADHLEFQPDGRIKAKTALGSKTLEIFGLNRRESLVKARRNAYQDAFTTFESCLAAGAARNTQRVQQLRPRVNEMWLGLEPYSAVQRVAIDESRTNFFNLFGARIAMPLPD